MDRAGERVALPRSAIPSVTVTRMDRARLPDVVVERIRRERYDPRKTQFDYLHLRDLKAQLQAAFARLPNVSGPGLDLFCGTQPYREMIPVKPVWGLDLDRHFGRTDVVSSVPLPFADATFGLVVCTQALHMVADPVATVREIGRVLKPGGAAVVTVPHIFRKEIPQEQQFSSEALRTLFRGWDFRCDGFGGRLSVVMYALAGLHNAFARRAAPARLLGIPLAGALNACAIATCKLTTRRANTFNASWLVVAKPIASSTPQP